jgi:hypothetical protein
MLEHPKTYETQNPKSYHLKWQLTGNQGLYPERLERPTIAPSRETSQGNRPVKTTSRENLAPRGWHRGLVILGHPQRAAFPEVGNLVELIPSETAVQPS